MSHLSKYLESIGHIRTDHRRVISEIGDLVFEYPDSPELTSEAKSDLAAALANVRELVSAHGKTRESPVVTAMILGKLGRFDEAIADAKAEYRAAPDWNTAIAVANVYRRADDLDSTIEWFTTAAGLDAKDVTAYLDIGDLQLRRGNTAKALEAYEAALARDKKQEWALPSVYYCRYLLTKRKKWLDKLRLIAGRPPDECGIQGVLAKVFGTYTPEQGRQRAHELLEGVE